MNAVSDHLIAIRIALEKLFQGKFWIYIFPSVAIFLVYYAITSLFSGITQSVSGIKELPLVGSYLQTGVEAAINVVDLVFNEFYKFLILTILSPINCLLSERVDNEITKSKFSGGIIRILSDLLRAIFIVIIALFFNLIFMLIWWLFAWITGFHLLDQIIYFLIACFFIGFSFYDFSLERYGIGTFGSWGFGFGKMPYMLATGTLFSLIFMIPTIGVWTAPFLVTIVSTIVYLKINNLIPTTKSD